MASERLPSLRLDRRLRLGALYLGELRLDLLQGVRLQQEDSLSVAGAGRHALRQGRIEGDRLVPGVLGVELDGEERLRGSRLQGLGFGWREQALGSGVAH